MRSLVKPGVLERREARLGAMPPPNPHLILSERALTLGSCGTRRIKSPHAPCYKIKTD
jgi:hypothetical protein